MRDILDSVNAKATNLPLSFFADLGADFYTRYLSKKVDIYIMSDGTNRQILWFPSRFYEDEADKRLDTMDGYLALFSLLIATMPLGCLIYATIHYEHQIARLTVWILIVVGLTPSVLCIILNLIAVILYRNEAESGRFALADVLGSIQLSSIFGDAVLDLPQYRQKRDE